MGSCNFAKLALFFLSYHNFVVNFILSNTILDPLPAENSLLPTKRTFFVKPTQKNAPADLINKFPAKSNGDRTSPFSDVQECFDALAKPGDECRLLPGRYSIPNDPYIIHNKHGTASQPIVISTSETHLQKVVFDGTFDIPNSAWKPANLTGKPDIMATPVSRSITQLFDAHGELQIAARWPNAFWFDKSVFQGPERWAHSTPPGIHNTTTRQGLLRDAGACSDDSDCCFTCNNNSLASSGINATNAIAILNLFSCDTAVQRVTKHTPGHDSFEYDATWVPNCDRYRDGLGRYYLEGKLEFLDAPTEWWFDTKSNLLYWWPPEDWSLQNFEPLHARGTNTWAINITNSSHLTLANFSVFAGALAVNDIEQDPDLDPSTKAEVTQFKSQDTLGEDPHSNLSEMYGKSQISENISMDLKVQLYSTNILFESLEFNYSTSDRRMLGDLSPPNGVTVWTSMRDHNGSRASTNMSYNGVVWRYSNGNVIFHAGSRPTFTDCLIEWNDWTTVGGCEPGEYSGSSTLCIDGQSHFGLFERLTFRNNGRSAGLRPGGSPKGAGSSDTPRIEKIHFSTQFELMGDGCFVEAGGNPAPTIQHCWSHDSGKSALRFDGMFVPPDNVKGTGHGQMLYNVGWNVSHLVVKGDHHNVSHNTVFDGPRELESEAHSLPQFQDSTSSLTNATIPSLLIGAGTDQFDPRADQHTVVDHNIFDFIAIGRKQCPQPPCKLPGIYKSNLVAADSPFDIKTELRDPWNWDFRPCPHSQAAMLGAGAYEPRNQLAPRKQYFIPGAHERIPSTPVPKHGGSDVIIDTDLMFLGAFRAIGHVVYLGKWGSINPDVVGILDRDDNVVSLPDTLKPRTRYQWRVDAILADGSNRTGDVWEFTTGSRLACNASLT